MKAVLRTLRLPVHVVNPQNLLPAYDHGLRAFLGWQENLLLFFDESFSLAKEGVLYRIQDEFGCRYLLFLLQSQPEASALLIGPFFTFEPTREFLQDKASALGLPPQRYPRFERLLSLVPCLPEEHLVLSLVTTYAELHWNTDACRVQDLSLAPHPSLTAAPAGERNEKSAASVERMQMLEERYAYENQLLDMVSRGWGHKAAQMMGNFSRLALEDRAGEPLRNTKNYGIVLNTLLRKAAERGGVHPIYLDRLSSEFASSLERLTDPDAVPPLFLQMILRYSALVRDHADRHYSPTVQKVIARIDLDLAGDMSLRTHAELLNISPGYLSGLFRKEVGVPLTTYVTRRRMEYAVFLLHTTRQSISSIAQQCGIQDDNYFTKLFRKHTGKTPRQFRGEQQL